MTAEAAIRRTALHDRAAELAQACPGGQVSITETAVWGMLNLRVRPGPAPAIEATLGCPLPQALSVTSSRDGVHVMWLGPDEFLVLRHDTSAMPVLSDAASVVDVSANRTMISLRGPKALSVLEKGIQIDLAGTADTAGYTWCAQTLLASVPIILWRFGDDWHLLVRPSFANYVADWLLDAAAEFTHA